MEKINKATTQTTKDEWVFIPVSKQRVLKNLDRAVLILIKDNLSTILPKVFMKKKQGLDFIYFSVPKNFKVNIRDNHYDESKKAYVNVDTLYDITSPTGVKLVKTLKEHLHEDTEEVIKTAKALEDYDLPF